ncbi:hypothetical protein HNV10_14725 [Winogradskyella litoriviva]|uniref:Uncharacterized protein n=1 Tax=Winogradskyella litoriviva TaxID=1220182 RepID=A0ABX2E7W2_9FLAO|nr:hypothetical protein [Winogradskyella litoriviva]NRD24510.1 hypothetical protein [Winogradskyella litoriviva]
MLDSFYITIFNHYKKALGKRSIKLALIYINMLTLSIAFALAAFFLAFAKQMKMQIMSNTKFWVLMTLASIFLIFMNWMRYNGKKRTILNAKSKHSNTSIYLLWIIPIACFAIAAILLQV